MSTPNPTEEQIVSNATQLAYADAARYSKLELADVLIKGVVHDGLRYRLSNDRDALMKWTREEMLQQLYAWGWRP